MIEPSLFDATLTYVNVNVNLAQEMEELPYRGQIVGRGAVFGLHPDSCLRSRPQGRETYVAELACVCLPYQHVCELGVARVSASHYSQRLHLHCLYPGNLSARPLSSR